MAGPELVLRAVVAVLVVLSWIHLLLKPSYRAADRWSKSLIAKHGAKRMRTVAGWATVVGQVALTLMVVAGLVFRDLRIGGWSSVVVAAAFVALTPGWCLWHHLRSDTREEL